MTDPRESVQSIVDELVAAVQQGDVPIYDSEAGPEDWAVLSYWAVMRGTGDWKPDIHKTSPLAVLDVLGTGVPPEFYQYIGVEAQPDETRFDVSKDYLSSETVLQAMAHRQLEEAVCEQLCDQADN